MADFGMVIVDQLKSKHENEGNDVLRSHLSALGARAARRDARRPLERTTAAAVQCDRR